MLMCLQIHIQKQRLGLRRILSVAVNKSSIHVLHVLMVEGRR